MALEQGLLFFLLPVAALSGWLIGRRRLPTPTESDSNPLNRDYLRGMNYLLSEQPDKAIEVFIRLAAVDNDTFETHLALGALFRRRGEVDRAIRIHQNLIARPNLSSDQKNQALFELAHDYLKLGVLDRAEAILSELKNTAHGSNAVLELLLQIYERERDWRGALSTAHLMMARPNPMPSISTRVSQYYCELVQQSLNMGNLAEVRPLLKNAFRTDSRCVRATLLEARLALIEENYRLALQISLRILDQDVRFLPLVIDSILELYGRLGDFSGRNAFLNQLSQLSGTGEEAKFLDIIRLRLKLDNDPADALRQYAKGQPTLQGLQEWFQARLKQVGQPDAGELVLFGDLLKTILLGHHRYRCGHCGFSGQVMHWQCPGCQQWSTITPLACSPDLSPAQPLFGDAEAEVRH
jgi:lipopolysaccharide biosynthesis regulator YciM